MNSIDYRSVMSRVLDQLVDECETRRWDDSMCCHCDDYADDQYTRHIFWRRYSFCGDRCQWEVEYDICKSHRQALKTAALAQKTK